MTLKKLLTYFVLWNFVFEHTLSLCAYAIGPLESVETPFSSRSSLNRVGTLAVPVSKATYGGFESNLTFSFKTLPGRFVGLFDLTHSTSAETIVDPMALATRYGADTLMETSAELLAKRRAVLNTIKSLPPSLSEVSRTSGGIELFVANIASTGEVLSKVVREYRSFVGGEETSPTPFMGSSSLRFVPNGQGLFMSLGEDLSFSIHPGVQIEVVKLRSWMPVRIESPWPLVFHAEGACVSSLHLKAPSIIHELLPLSGDKYEAVITDALGIWRSSTTLSGFSEFSLWGGYFKNEATLEFYGKSASINTNGFHNHTKGFIIGEDIGQGSGLTVRTPVYSNDGTLEMDTLRVVAQKDFSHIGKTTIKGDYHLTVDGSGVQIHSGETRGTNIFVRGKGTLENTGIIGAEGFLTIEGLGLENRQTLLGKTLRLGGSFVANDGTIRAVDSLTLHSKSFDNRGVFDSSEKLKLETGHLSNTGTIEAKESVSLTVNSFENRGTIKGESETKIKIRGTSYSNENGTIGGTGSTKIEFLQRTGRGDIGTIQGERVFLKDLSDSDTLSFLKGTVFGKVAITVVAKTLIAPAVIFETPLLEGFLKDFNLGTQGSVGEFRLYIPRGQDFALTHSFKSSGSLSFWEEGLTEETVKDLLVERFGADHTIQPVPDHTLRLKSSIQVKDLRVALPFAHLEIGELEQDPIELLMIQGQLKAELTSFDLIQGTIAALNASLYAPTGLKIGRLVRDTTRDVISTFSYHSQCPTSHTLGNFIRSLWYELGGERIEGVYDGRHLVRLPLKIRNDAHFLTQELLDMTGPLQHQGCIKSGDFHLTSPFVSRFTGSVTKINGNATFDGRGDLLLNRLVGIIHFYYCHYASEFEFKQISGEPTEFYIGGLLDSRGKIINSAGVFHAKNKISTTEVESNSITVMHQKFMGGSLEERLALSNDSPPYSTLRSGAAVYGPDVSIRYIWSFLYKTNNFEGAQGLFPAITSFEEGIVLPADNTTIEGYFSAPLALISVASGGLVLGRQNPHYIPPQKQIYDLFQRGLDGSTVHINEYFAEKLSSQTTGSYLFKMQERFWHDEHAAQSFCRSIADHIVTINQEGLFKHSRRALFALSPQLLLDKVREATQESLMRGYIEEGQPIDLETLKILHQNASEYLKTTEESSLVLIRAIDKAQGANLPTKPLIYYKELLNENGEKELIPQIYFPRAMLDEARGDRGGKIRIPVLGIIPAGVVTQRQLMDMLDAIPGAKTQVMAFLDKNHTARQLLLKDDDLTSELAHPTGGDGALVEATERMEGRGSVELHGDIQTQTLAVAVPGNIRSTANIETTDALLASLLGTVHLQTTVERIGQRGNSQDVILAKSRVIAQGILNILARENIVFESVETHSELGTHLRALGAIYDIPVALSREIIRDYGSVREEYHARNMIPSHVTSAIEISYGARNIILVAPTMEAPVGGFDAQQSLSVLGTSNAESFLREEHSKKRGTFGGSKSRVSKIMNFTETFVSATLNIGTLTARAGKFYLEAPRISGEYAYLTGEEFALRHGLSTYQGFSYRSTSDMWWNSSKAITESRRTHVPPFIDTNLHVDATRMLLDQKGGENSLALIKDFRNATPEIRVIYDDYNRRVESNSALGTLPSILIAAAITAAMPGVGTGLTATLTQAGFSATASQVAIGTLSNGGDLGAGLRGVLSWDGLRNIGMAMATAGLVEGIEQALPSSLKGAQGLNTQKSIEQHLASGFTKSIAGGVAGTAFGRRFDIEDILGTGFVEGLGALGANMICDWYNKNPDYYWAHKTSHFGLGALMGASLNSKDPATAALAGGVGGVTAEMFAEMLFGGPKDLAQNPINPDSIRTEAFVSKMLGGIAGTLASQGEHPHIAFMTAHNAVENNAALRVTTQWLLHAAAGGAIVYKTSEKGGDSGRKKSGSKEGKSSGSKEPKDPKGGKRAPPVAAEQQKEISKNQRLKKDDIAKNNTIDLKRFSKSGVDGSKIDPKTRFDLRPDRAGERGHGGSYYKLYYNGKRAAALDKLGRVVRIYDGWK